MKWFRGELCLCAWQERAKLQQKLDNNLMAYVQTVNAKDKQMEEAMLAKDKEKEDALRAKEKEKNAALEAKDKEMEMALGAKEREKDQALKELRDRFSQKWDEREEEWLQHEKAGICVYACSLHVFVKLCGQEQKEKEEARQKQNQKWQDNSWWYRQGRGRSWNEGWGGRKEGGGKQGQKGAGQGGKGAEAKSGGKAGVLLPE